MKKLVLFLLLISGQAANAQKFAIKGQVAEKQSGALPAASVVLLHPQDSIMIQNTITNTAGGFVLKDIQKGAYRLKITYLGFTPYVKALAPPTQTDTLDLGTILLEPVASELPVVTVTAPSTPVEVKKDTVEYNSAYFLTRPQANVEHLLQKLPGVKVERNGTIQVQGENVTRILVDGKEYFGGDLQQATKNLPAEAIEKVQVIDEKSEDARFSGVDDGRRRKVINLTLKENRRNMGFGKALAGAGPGNRYAAHASYHRFEQGKQVSAMGMSNNVNNPGLTADGPGMGTGLNGRGKIHLGGINFSNQLTPKTRINGNYRANYTDANIERNLTRQHFQAEGTTRYAEQSKHQNQHKRHQAQLGLERDDSLNTLRLNTSFSFADVHAVANTSRRSYSAADSLVNEGERSSSTQNQDLSLQTHLFYGHRFGKKGRLFTLNSAFDLSRNEMQGHAASSTRFRQGAREAVRQENQQADHTRLYSLRLAYSEPVGNRQYLQAHYQLSNRSANTHLEVFDLTDESRHANTQQSNRFRAGYQYQQVGLTYRLNRDQYALSIGADGQQAGLSRRLADASVPVKRSFRNILPSLHYHLNLSRTSRLSFHYTTGVREPAIQQLQPVVLRYDPLNLQVGNPDLRPEYTHQGKLSFNRAAPASGLYLAGSLNFTYTANPITAAITTDNRQVRTTQYVNVSRDRHLSAFLNLGLPLEKLHSSLTLSPYLRYRQGINLLNGIAGTITQQSLGGDLSYSYQYEELLDVNLRTNAEMTHSAFALTSQRQRFITAAYMADVTLHFLSNFDLTAAYYLNKYRNTSIDFNQSIPVLNLSLSWQALRNNQGWIKLSGINVLNRNIGAVQRANLNYTEQVTHNTPGSYFLLSFTYNLQNIGSK